MSSVLDKIRLYGRSRDTEALEEYIKTVNTDQVSNSWRSFDKPNLKQHS